MDGSSILDEVVSAGEPLAEAMALGRRAADVGFDWPEVTEALAKVREEVTELDDELSAAEPRRDRIEAELGDLLFAVVNVARKLNVDPRGALALTNRTFRERFRHVEERVASRGKTMDEATLSELEALWSEAKREP